MTGAWIAAWLDIRSSPFRTLAAVAGMVVAVTALILVNAANLLSRQANEEFIAATYGRVATYQILVSGEADLARDDPQAETGIVHWLNQNGITRVSVATEVNGVLISGGTEANVNAAWVSSTYPAVALLDAPLEAFPLHTATAPVMHAVITPDLARDLGFSPEAVGKVVQLLAWGAADLSVRQSVPSHPVVVDAVVDSLGSGFASSTMLLVSDHYQPALMQDRPPTWLVHVNPVDGQRLISLVRQYDASQGEQDGALTVTRVDRGEELQPLLDQQAVTAAIVSLVALAVGGLGVLGAGIASVRERSIELGLRRAIGATRRLVFFGVVVQTIMEALLAALVAIPIAAILVRLFARQLVLSSLPLPTSVTLPIDSVVLGLLGAVVVGLLAGILPAIRASRITVAAALGG